MSNPEQPAPDEAARDKNGKKIHLKYGKLWGGLGRAAFASAGIAIGVGTVFYGIDTLTAKPDESNLSNALRYAAGVLETGIGALVAYTTVHLSASRGDTSTIVNKDPKR